MLINLFSFFKRSYVFVYIYTKKEQGYCCLSLSMVDQTLSIKYFDVSESFKVSIYYNIFKLNLLQDGRI